MTRTWTLPNSRRIRLVEGDITKVATDAVANAANSALAGGGGVDGAVHRAGGPVIMRELEELRPEDGLPPGQAVVTSAGGLPAKFVFHTVGPVYRGGNSGEPEALASCYRSCLALAETHSCGSVSFPAISTGVYGYPAKDAAEIAFREVLEFLLEKASVVEEVIFVQYGIDAYEIYDRLLAAELGR
jgi:O-acetyl-ADP-ribose deacetylase (regulator of RNase III)